MITLWRSLLYVNQGKYGAKSGRDSGTLNISRLHMVKSLAALYRSNEVLLLVLVS